MTNTEKKQTGKKKKRQTNRKKQTQKRKKDRWTKRKENRGQKETRTTFLVRNAGCVCSRYTLKLSIIFRFGCRQISTVY